MHGQGGRSDAEQQGGLAAEVEILLRIDPLTEERLALAGRHREDGACARAIEVTVIARNQGSRDEC